ncbi:2-succinylbenzoate--CoA ligase [BD1-7 clade bacterium]|uniref:2-succinylbenzoate--CoA ligase n=1 Tax=BD1-7 clade bacterium TaxID=2029982 RepID=A0A5S9PGM8_9GAMM|nr:2-succinylbenzoate--CoA ligase [BD1-7 clade bacterium]
MLRVNNIDYSADNLKTLQAGFQSIDALQALTSATPQRIAVCLEDTFTWLALCFYLRDKQHSVMPLHTDTPIDAAQKSAKQAGCEWLFYHTLSNAIQIPSNTNVPTLTPAKAGLIQMSSGTTGTPKCIERSWHTIATEIESYIAFFTETDDMTPVVACPVTHSYGLICGVMVALARGKAPIIITNINPRFLLKTLQTTERPLLYASPIMLQGIVRLWPADKKLHAIMTSGSIMTQPIFDELRPRIDNMYQQYGCSEAGCISINRQMTRPDDLGEPLPHLAMSAGDDSHNPDEIIVTASSNHGALNRIHTQDLGYLQQSPATGKYHLHFVTRLDDTVIVSGLNVYPQDVENTLLQHPQIDDVVVFKTDDKFAGQRVCARYVAAQSLDPHVIRQWCLTHMAPFQVPSQLQQVDQIERMANGKISRKQVARDFVKDQQAAQQQEIQQHAKA